MTRSQGPALTLFLREGTRGPTRARQDAALDRARRLVTNGVAADLDVVHWDKKIPIGSVDGDHETVLEAFNAFSDWARRADVRLYPAFQTRECYSWEDGQKYTALVLPVMCLGVRCGGELGAVYPHVDDDRFSVFDGLAILTADQHDPVIDNDSEVAAE